MSLIATLVRFVGIVIIAIASLAIVAPAGAQGTSGQVPDPMSSAELSKLLQLYVQPTKDQGAAIESLHDDYREQFRKLRDGDIEKFLQKMKALQGGMMPSKDQVEDFTKGYERVQRQIAEIDDAFFDGIATLLGENRRASVDRARDARARTRMTAGVMNGMMGQTPTVDLSAIVLETGLSPKDLETIDPLLVSYEQRLTATSKELGQLGMRMIRDMFDTMEKAGLGNLSQEEMMADPEKMKAVMETMQAAMKKAGERFSAKAKDIGELNSKTFRSIESQLSGDAKRKVRVRYVGRAYPELANDPSQAERMFRMATRIKSLDEAGKEQLGNAYQQWQAGDDALVDSGIKMSDEFRSTRDLMDFGAGYAEHNQKMAEITQKRAELGAKSLQSVSSVLGDERMKMLFDRQARKFEDAFAENDDPLSGDDAANGASIAVRASDMEMAQSEYTRSRFGGPIGVATIASLATQLSLDDSRKALLETMHTDYMKRWDEEFVPIQQRTQEAESKRWVQPGEDGEAHSDPVQRSAFFDGRRLMAAKIAELDSGFFDDLMKVLGDESSITLRLARLDRAIERSSPADGSGGMFGVFGAPESPVNFVAVLRAAELLPADRTKVNAALAEQIDSLLQVNVEGAAAAIDQEREMDELNERNMALYRNGTTPDMAEMQKAGVAQMAMQQKMTERRTRLADASRKAWSAALAVLDESQRDVLQLAYDERAYPSIFMDQRSAMPFIEKAQDLSDLNDDQKQQLQVLRDRYHTEYVAFCRKMVPKGSEEPEPSRPEDMQRYWQAQMERMNAIEKVRFDRNERSQRAVSQLRRILNDEQSKRLAGLENYERSTTDNVPGFGGAVQTID